MRVFSEEAGLCERATASFWAKSLQKKKPVKVSWKHGAEGEELQRGKHMKEHEDNLGTETGS